MLLYLIKKVFIPKRKLLPLWITVVIIFLPAKEESVVKSFNDACFRDINGWSPLHKAVIANNIQLVQSLLNKGADVESLSLGGWTSLHLASCRGNVAIAELLIENGTDVNCQVVAGVSKGYTPLHLAVKEGDEVMGAFLIDAGAKLNVKENDSWAGDAPLHLAARDGHKEIIKTLFKAGANVLIQNNSKETLLHVVLRNEYPNLVKYILQQLLPPKIPYQPVFIKKNGECGVKPLLDISILKYLNNYSYENEDQIRMIISQYFSNIMFSDNCIADIAKYSTIKLQSHLADFWREKKCDANLERLVCAQKSTLEFLRQLVQVKDSYNKMAEDLAQEIANNELVNLLSAIRSADNIEELAEKFVGN